ncbi:NXPE family member 2-like isoform X2 [Argopecten irradians]|uniref:NXPE family member 2-like isoform X2 n=1 Tax=Argopecten irradians TaxID=31199 RepID=UPI0037223A37
MVKIMDAHQKKRKKVFVFTTYRLILMSIGIIFITWNITLYWTNITVSQKPLSKTYVKHGGSKDFITTGYLYRRNPIRIKNTSSGKEHHGMPTKDVASSKLQRHTSFKGNPKQWDPGFNSEDAVSENDLMKELEKILQKQDIFRKNQEKAQVKSDSYKPEIERNDVSSRAGRSVIQIEKSSRKYFLIGDKFQLTVYMKDKFGKNVTQGGDFVRIWLKETSINSHVNGVVTDNGDGTYSGEVLLPWAGHPTVRVALSHTKEDVNTVTKAINKYGLLNKMYARFINKDKSVSENVPCGPLPVFSLDQEEMCNLTKLNYGYSWYSAKPSSAKLSCDDWVYIRGTNNLTVPDLVADRIRYTQHRQIGEDITITVIGKPANVIKTKPTLCSKRPREMSWREPSPSGFNYRGNWIITSCHSNLTQTVRNYHKCLMGRHVLILGDSNTRSFVQFLVYMLEMSYRTKPMPMSSWHDFTYAENQYNNSLSWYPHGSPFFANFFIPKYKLQPISKHLDEIGSANNSVVIIHMWGHFMRIPYKVFRLHVRKIRASVENLLRRSPDVDIIIKGPHAMTYFDWITPVDAIWRKHKQIWFEEFQGLHNRVLFLNFWDITVGVENVDIHPESKVVWSQIHMLMQLLCLNAYR